MAFPWSIPDTAGPNWAPQRGACHLLVRERASFKAQIRWNSPQVIRPYHPRGAMLLYQEGALASSILEHPAGIANSGGLHSRANADITSVNHILLLWAHLHLLCHTGLASVPWTCRLPPNLHIEYNQISSWLGHYCHSGLVSNITSSERIFLTTSLHQSKVASSSQIFPFIFNSIYI